ncbi:MAG: MFS transporter [Actinomycetota bacterium]|nr:MFS transporter [Actinomycetota bacterium]
MQPSEAPPTWSPTRPTITGWLLYDLANTIFALGVAGLYFPIWVVSDQGWPDAAISMATSSAMAVVIVAAPWLGARSDHIGRRLPYLRSTTVLAVAATFLLATVSVPLSLVLFALALVGFHLGSVLYDALLPDVSRPDNRGWISGMGVGAGYVGSFIAVGAGALVRSSFGLEAVFKVMAALFLLMALPAFVLIRERPRPRRRGPPPAPGDALAQLLRSWRRARRHPGTVRFLTARFLYTDAINTVILFLAVFAVEEVGFTTRQVELLLPLAITSAVVGGVATGRSIDVLGPRRCLHGALYLWMGALALGIAAALAQAEALAWVVGVAGGFALGATGASDRVYMARISPPRFLGEFFGLYGIVGRFATILGPLVWALVVDALQLGRVAAMAVLLGFLLAARLILSGVSDADRAWGLGDREEAPA